MPGMVARTERKELGGGTVSAMAERETDASRTGTVRAPKIARPARPEPNAPLLKRVVRYPFVLEKVRFVRAKFEWIAIEARAERAPRPGVGRPFAELLGELTSGEGRGPERRDRPRWVAQPFPRGRRAGGSEP